MIGGNFTSIVEGNRSQHDKTTSPQLQLIGNVPTQYPAGLGMINYASSEQTPTNIRPNKRVREEEPPFVQMKLGMSSLLLNPNRVSPGLRLSREKVERSSSVTSTTENLTNASHFALSLGNTLKMEMDHHMEELGHYIKLQEESILKGGREINQRHTISLLNTLENGLNKRLREKDIEIESINCKNKELEERIKEVSMEAQSWHYKAKNNESIANTLKRHIEQLMASNGREGFGESEVDDTLSQPGSYGNGDLVKHRLQCRSCKKKEISILLFPCRHLCLCEDCEGLSNVCPVCNVMKTASFPVNL